MDNVTRRDLLKTGAQGAAVVGGGLLLNACGSDSSSPTQKAPTSEAKAYRSSGGGTPVRGGTLTLNTMSGGGGETLDPAIPVQVSDLIRQYQLFDLLFGVSDTVGVEPRLATSAEANEDATVWIFKLRQGVKWHDGKPFTADDVVYTFRTWGSPKSYAYGTLAGLVDFPHVKKLDPFTVQVRLLQPVAEFPSLLTGYYNLVRQDGSTAASFKRRPIGTGPFMFESFHPGRQSVFVRNPDYWEPGEKPYVDRLVVDSSFTDEASRLNALLSGQSDILAGMPASAWRQQQKAGNVTVLACPSPSAFDIPMRVDKAPFNDVRVRQALRYVTDRQGLIDGAFGGLANVGNDLHGGTKEFRVKHFADLPPRPHDPEKAKSLLKAAGRENLAFKFPIAPALPGYVEIGTLFAEQAKAAGVRIALETVPVQQYFAYPLYPNRPIQASNVVVFPSLTAYYRPLYISGSATGETHWGSPEHDKLINQAVGATDPSLAAEMWNELQRQQYDQGGYIVFAQAYLTDAVGKHVRGIKAGPAGLLNNMRLLDGWRVS